VQRTKFPSISVHFVIIRRISSFHHLQSSLGHCLSIFCLFCNLSHILMSELHWAVARYGYSSIQVLGATSSSFRGGKMTSSCLLNRGTNFLQTPQLKLSSKHLRNSELFSFNQYADRTIRTEKISSLIQTLYSVFN